MNLEFVSLGELARVASILGPESGAALALGSHSALAQSGKMPICLQVLDGTYPAKLLVFDAAEPPAELSQSWRCTCTAVAKRVGRRRA
jgi:hypothetical protein